MKPTYLVSMLEGIRRRVDEGVRVEYAEGVDPASAVDLLPGPPLVPSSVLTPAGSGPEVHGLHAEYRTNTRFEGEPLFPFGYGLSYTSFAYAQLQVEPETSDGTRAVQVRFMVTNTGSRAGAEIAQVYLGLPASTSEPPKRLVSWARVEVDPGETKKISVTLDPNSASRPLSYWNVNRNGWEIASGDYTVYVGASSRDIRLTSTLRVHHTEKE